MPRDIRLGWEVETLNKAYRQGYMTGVMGMARERCPYRGDVVIAAWEAGWDDGQNELEQQEKERRANPWIA
ncbi:ribosome modulation factor [Tamilnaduibacter salinus]|uniref:Ribosome modulation factor n=1 Tax=Tamilnaduibacter salinus TaxID=1484056 RepID=A0A2A2HYY3_9GAMM|nr:ribosome modulation factor [Tamilnaduibacter salinus]PAV24791.1 hypothetical protein CF392_14415 [Tamilnaduibacter salinus]PVY76903.1 ribosome modulation factor [Tamilnaduibacter salinus]